VVQSKLRNAIDPLTMSDRSALNFDISFAVAMIVFTSKKRMTLPKQKVERPTEF
jgi:hypothetical protein